MKIFKLYKSQKLQYYKAYKINHHTFVGFKKINDKKIYLEFSNR